MKKKFLIIGSNSFAGSNFINYLLNKKFNVIGLSRSKENSAHFSCYKKNLNLKNFIFYKIDLNKGVDKIIKTIKKHKPSYIINFAAQGMVNESWERPLDWYNTNIISQVDLFEKIKSFSFIKKYINFSTPEVFGNNNNELFEDAYFKPSTPYAISRAAFDYHLAANSHHANFPIILTRTANIYGPYQKLYRVVPKAIVSFLNKRNFYLDGSGSSVRSFIFMDDVSEALFKIIKSKKKIYSYHIATNKFVTIENLVKRIGFLMKIDSTKYIKKIKKDRIGKDHVYKLNNNKIKKNLSWKPKTHLDKGILETIKWIKKDYKNFKSSDLIYKHIK